MSTLLNEEVAAQTWLRDYLASDAALGNLVNDIWVRSVPESAPLPVVKIDRLEATDLYVTNLYRVWGDLLFLVRGIVHWRGGGEQQDWSEAAAIADRIDVLLHKHEETSSTIQVHCFREESYSDEQEDPNGLLFHCGGLYRIRAHAL